MKKLGNALSTALIFIIIISIVGISVWIFFAINTGNEARPAGSIIDSSYFREISFSKDYDCEGNVDLIQISGGGYVLYFYDMEVDSLTSKVIMSQETSFNDQFVSLGDNVEIGLLPYKYGSFSVAVPASVNPSLYNSIVIAHSISYSIAGYARI